MSLTTTFYTNSELAEITGEHIKDLKIAAREDVFKRARICLHKTPDAPIHEMVIAMLSDSYSRPHRNVRNSKSYCIIEGDMYIVIFDNSGLVLQKISIGSGMDYKTFICRLNSNVWHTVVPISEVVVFLETNGGPFIKEKEEYAPWSPEDDDREGIRLLLHKLTDN